MTTTLQNLQPGDRFRVPSLNWTGRLERLGPGSATVTLDRPASRRTFETRWGERVTFTAPGSKRTTIALGTAVERA